MPPLKNVAVLMNLSRIYDRQLMEGVTRYFHDCGCWQIYVKESPTEKISSFSGLPVEGMIVDIDDRQNAKAISTFGGAVVGIGQLPPEKLQELGISSVNSDNEMIAYWAADHLIDKGIRNFAYCGMPTQGLGMWVDIRRESFHRRVRERGYSCWKFTGRRYAPQSWDKMLAELMKWISKLPKPIGIMACNDSRGRSVLEACRKLQLKVPDDVAVIGVDNDELLCELAVPPLSSIKQGTEQTGYQAAKLLDELMRGRRRRPIQLLVPPVSIFSRHSTDLVDMGDPIVASALKFIREHYAEGIDGQDLVRNVCVSRSTLENRFKQHLGRTVHSEIMRARLDAARRLLTSTDLPLHIISQRCGFSSLHYMCAVFRRELGHPPGQLRR